MNDAYGKYTLPAMALMLLCLGVAAPCPARSPDLRLYVFDCGHATFKDMGGFSDTGEYDGKPGEIAVPCFLIRHPKGDLLWDTGLGDHYNYPKEGSDAAPGVHVTVPVTLLAQLQSLKLTPKDINFIAFSHLHWDHTGNANEFPDSVWIMNKTELAWALVSPPPGGRAAGNVERATNSAKNETIEADYDVFGDGRVMILRAPGTHARASGLETQIAKERHRHSFGRSLSSARQSTLQAGAAVQHGPRRYAGLDEPHRNHLQEHSWAFDRAARSQGFSGPAQTPGVSRLSRNACPCLAAKIFLKS